MRRLFGVLIAFVIVSTADAKCGLLGTSVNTPESFLAHPGSILSRYPQGESNMRGEIANLAAVSAASVQALIEIASVANGPQKEAIGMGIAEAWLQCAGRDPAQASEIKDAVKRSTVAQVRRVFSAEVDRDAGTIGGEVLPKTAKPNPTSSTMSLKFGLDRSLTDPFSPVPLK